MSERGDSVAGDVPSQWYLDMKAHVEAAESLLEEAREALRPFAENWDFHAADYLAELVDGKEQRIIEASVIADIIEAVNNARAFLAKLEAR